MKPKSILAQQSMFTPRAPELRLTFEDLLPGEDAFDNFAGGGGISTGTVQATGKPVRAALNHDPEAIAMHAANHPETKHYCEDITLVDPREVCRGRKPGLAWFAPDCTHHSKAKGGKPRDSKSRGLAQVVIDWAKLVKPRLIMVENVEEFEDWGPLDADGHPDKTKLGEYFRPWLAALVDAGYAVDFRCLVAADLGAPTTRNRFFLVARRDGLPIIWPEATHGAGRALPWKTAASDVLDFSIPTVSIFGRPYGRFRPLAPASLRRIGLGLQRFVVEHPDPFIIPVTHPRDARVHSIHEPLRTVTAAHRGEFAFVSPFVAKYHASSTPRGQHVEEPLRTIDTSNRFGLVTPFIVRHGHYSKKTGAGLVPGVGMPGIFRGQTVEAPIGTVTTRDDKNVVVPVLTKHYGGTHGHQSPGSAADAPLGAVTSRDHHAVSAFEFERASFVTKFYGTSIGSDAREPLPTVTATGQHLAEVRAFLLKYYGAGGRVQGQDPRNPLHTVTTTDRFALITIHGEPYQLVDIGMRMLTPRELFRAQDFQDDYIIDVEVNGKRLSKEAQIRCAGNAAPPCYARRLVEANTRGEARAA